MPSPTYDDAEAVLRDAKKNIDHVLALLRIWQDEPKKTRLSAPSVAVGDRSVSLAWTDGLYFEMVFVSPTVLRWYGDGTEGTGFTDGIKKLRELIRGKK